MTTKKAPHAMKGKRHLFEGLPVVDATEDLHLHIKPLDIKNSKKNDPSNCAAAKAINREHRREVRVFIGRTYVKERKHWVRYMTPSAISREITSFDRGASFEPGEFVVKAPTVTARLGNHRPGGYGGKHTGKGKPNYHATGMVRGFKSRK